MGLMWKEEITNRHDEQEVKDACNPFSFAKDFGCDTKTPKQVFVETWDHYITATWFPDHDLNGEWAEKSRRLAEFHVPMEAMILILGISLLAAYALFVCCRNRYSQRREAIPLPIAIRA